MASVSDRLTPYPGRRWVRALRFVLLTLGWFIPLGWVVVVVESRDRLARHGITALHHIFGNLFNLDKVAWSYAIDVALIVLLAAGAIRATRDWVREEIEMSRRRRAQPHVSLWVEAEQRWRAKLAEAQAHGDGHDEMRSLGGVGMSLLYQGRHAEAEPYLTQALALARNQSDRFYEERELSHLAEVVESRGDLDGAEKLYRESLAVSGQIANPEVAHEEVADGSAVLGEFLIETRGQRAEGLRLLEEAEQCYRTYGKLGRARAQRMRSLIRQYGTDTSGATGARL